jgi:hypothetical protein
MVCVVVRRDGDNINIWVKKKPIWRSGQADAREPSANFFELPLVNITQCHYFASWVGLEPMNMLFTNTEANHTSAQSALLRG